MKNLKRRWLAFCLAAALALAMTGCGRGPASGNTAAEEETAYESAEAASGSQAARGKIRLLVAVREPNDRSYEQSFYEGALRVQEEQADRYEVNIMTLSPDSKDHWKTELLKAAEEADLIAAADYQICPLIEEIAGQYKEKKFLLMDKNPTDSAENENILSVLFNTQEAAFLAGAAAAYYTVGENAANSDKTIGFVGGIQEESVNRYLTGFARGARHVEPEMKILSAYTGSFSDKERAKEVAEDQILEGADIIFSASGESGEGVLEAISAKDGAMAIGVDSDQYETYGETSLQPVILTSCLKELGTALYDLCDLYSRNPQEMSFGSALYLGLKENCTGLVYNDNLTAGLGEDQVKKLRDLEQKLLSGEIQVSGAGEMQQDPISDPTAP